MMAKKSAFFERGMCNASRFFASVRASVDFIKPVCTAYTMAPREFFGVGLGGALDTDVEVLLRATC